MDSTRSRRRAESRLRAYRQRRRTAAAVLFAIVVAAFLASKGGGSGKDSRLCREFDADLANAYVERSLTASETARYEQHLAACSPCRKSIIALTRMASLSIRSPSHRTVRPSPLRERTA